MYLRFDAISANMAGTVTARILRSEYEAAGAADAARPVSLEVVTNRFIRKRLAILASKPPSERATRNRSIPWG
jgi:hypothetical protein